jgi:colicin import membrane protein
MMLMPIVRCDASVIREGYVSVIMGYIESTGNVSKDEKANVEAYVSNLEIDTSVRRAGGRRKMTDEEREERDRLRTEAKAKKQEELREKRAAAKEARDADKKLWMTPQRLTDSDGKQFQGVNGAWLRVQKNRTTGEYRMVKVENWFDEAKDAFTAFVEAKKKAAAAGPDMAKKALAEATKAKKAEDKKKLLAEKKAALLAKKMAKKKAAEELKAKKLAEKDAKKKAAEELKAKKLAEKEAMKKAAEELKAKKLAEKEAMKKAAEELKAKKLAEEKVAEEAKAKELAEIDTTAIVEDDMNVEDIELDNEDFSDVEEEMEDFTCAEFPGEQLKIDENGFIYNADDELVAVRDEDGNIDIQ